MMKVFVTHLVFLPIDSVGVTKLTKTCNIHVRSIHAVAIHFFTLVSFWRFCQAVYGL